MATDRILVDITTGLDQVLGTNGNRWIVAVKEEGG